MLKLPDISDWTQAIGQVVCCDCLDLMKIIPDKSIDLVLTDPPYGINFEYDEYEDTLENLKNIIEFAIPQIIDKSKLCTIMSGISNIQLYPIYDWMMMWTWNTTGSFGKMGINQYMPLLVYGKDIKGFGSINGVLKSDVFSISGGASIGFLSEARNCGHPSPKPLNVIKHFIKRLSILDDLIFDPFAGSFTTALAAEQLGRRWIACDISEKYCQIGEKRLVKERVQGKFEFQGTVKR